MCSLFSIVLIKGVLFNQLCFDMPNNGILDSCIVSPAVRIFITVFYMQLAAVSGNLATDPMGRLYCGPVVKTVD